MYIVEHIYLYLSDILISVLYVRLIFKPQRGQDSFAGSVNTFEEGDKQVHIKVSESMIIPRFGLHLSLHESYIDFSVVHNCFKVRSGIS